MRLMDFCEKCGTMMELPGRRELGKVREVSCFNQKCTFKRPIEDYIAHKTTYTMTYGSDDHKKQNQTEEDVVGPQIEHQCKVCKHNLATYFTRQMRSADEGQTVFYTCLKCRNVEREDS